MGHFTKIDGTAYEIIGGKTKIGGTIYDVAGGKTKIGGTGYSINFGKPLTLAELFGTAVNKGRARRSSSSLGQVSLNTQNTWPSSPYPTYYLLYSVGENLEISKITRPTDYQISKTIIKKIGNQGVNVSGNFYLIGANQVYGGYMQLLEFEGVSDDVIVPLLTNMTVNVKDSCYSSYQPVSGEVVLKKSEIVSDALYLVINSEGNAYISVSEGATIMTPIFGAATRLYSYSSASYQVSGQYDMGIGRSEGIYELIDPIL